MLHKFGDRAVSCPPLRKGGKLLCVMASLLLATSVGAGDQRSHPEAIAPLETFTADQRAHWAYQPVKRPEPPAVKEAAWVTNPIDRFILAGLESLGLPHSAPADRVALIRRVTFDLTGLPPSRDEVALFLGDDRPDAYERLVERLLASPHYGERSGQHWLDLAHYADSNGFELDAERPDAWRYRDWVVRAYNSDLPYDRFLTLQIAGDDLWPGDRDALIATGFCRCGPREVVGGNVIPEAKRQTELAEITATVGSVFLGLTIGCARCHDHKYDAIPSTDYYRLQSFWSASELTDVPIASQEETKAFEAARSAIDKTAAPFKQQLAALEAPYRAALQSRKMTMLSLPERTVMNTPEKDRTPAQKRLAKGLETSLRITWEEVAAAVAANSSDHARREALKRAIYGIERTLPRPPAHAMALVDQKANAADTFVLRRGDYKSKGPKVAPRPPGVILASQPSGSFPASIDPRGGKTGRRAALARWLTVPSNPLSARVLANRLWQHHFGRGIVATPSDFGVRGDAPSHPELLDWLASELIAGGWRQKSLERLIVTSAAYRQSTRPPAKLAAEDPENSLFGRMNRRRLDAEGIRDAMLAVSGELNPRMGGPGVLAPLEKEIKDLIFTEAEVVDLWPVDRDPAEYLRRSLYLFRKRNVRYPLFDAFDAPDTQNACPRRETSTHALQALVLLNSDFATGRAKVLAGRLLRLSRDCNRDRITLAYQVVLARDPRPTEIERAEAFLKSQTELIDSQIRAGRSCSRPSGGIPALRPAEGAAWVDFALALLNCNEFLYVP
ncbi:MAG: DUF1549 and DUF1553 domain-containing protein [Isosphaeraceae bacterium]